MQARRLMLAVMLAATALLLLAGCAGKKSPAGEPAAQAQTAIPTPFPASGGSAVLQPESGGSLGLSSGAELTIPPGVLREATLVSLRETNAHPNVPVPRTRLGPAYEFSINGTALDGVALLTLPLPEGIDPKEYEVGAYRWNGRLWERVSGRLAGDKVQIAARDAGLFALQGTWKLASAALNLALPQGGIQPGMVSIPFTVTGQYRYAALPALQRGYTPVRLELKRDTSGGAGQVTGEVGLDQTVTETTLWFQPDPNQSRGEIPFQHVFEIQPGSIDAMPGSTSRYYAVFQAEDSSAPTSQLSTGVDYTHVLPIRIVGSDVVRPEMSSGASKPLQWNIRLNGQPWQEIPADRQNLALDDVLARGGIGDYEITLETQADGQWFTASNKVSVKLAPPPEDTPVGSETPAAPGEPGDLIALTTPTPAGPMPPTPTGRPGPAPVTPDGAAAPTPTPTTSVTPVVTATRPPGSQVFWADKYAVTTGECTMLHWSVQDVTAVYLDGQSVTGEESRSVCPTQSTTYILRIVAPSGTQERRVTISVGEGTAGGIIFTADRYQILEGGCAMLNWRTQDVREVYLNDQGVAGEASKQVCPLTTTTYVLRVVDANGATTSRSLTVAVLPGSGIPLQFWADQYTLSPGSCTNLYWSVEGVEAVYVGRTGSEQGVPGVGSRQECPVGRVSYTLQATTGDGRTASKQIILLGQEPTMGADQVIAHALVREVVRSTDVNPTTAGDQPGWNVVVDGVDVLFSGENNCCQDRITLGIPQALIDQQAVFGVPIDWPINPGQLVEFRARCSDTSCSLDSGPPMYLRLRSQ